MKLKEQLVRNLFLTFITEAFGYISNFAILFFLIKFYSHNVFVYYPLTTGFLILFLIFANFGLGITIIRFLSATGNDLLEEAKKLISEGFRLVFIFTIISSIVLFFIADFIELLYRTPGLSLVLKFSSIYLLFSNLIYYFENVFRGLLDFKFYALSSIFLNFFKLIVVLFNIYNNNPIYIIFAFYSIISLIQFSLVFIIAQKKYKFLSFIDIFDFNLSKKLLKYSTCIFFPILFNFLILNFNQFILAYYVEPKILAVYYITLMFMLFFSMPIIIFTKLVLPHLTYSNLKNEENRKNICLIYNSIYKYGLLVMIPICIFFFFASRYFVIIIFGEEYLLVANYLGVFIFYLIIRTLDLGGEQFLLALDQQKFVFIFSSMTALIILILSFILIPFLYVYGAILSIIIPHSIYVIYSNYIVRKKHNIKIERATKRSILIYLFSSLISLFLIYSVIIYFNINLFINFFLIFFSLLYLTFFLSFIFLLKAIKLDEIREFIEILKFSKNYSE